MLGIIRRHLLTILLLWSTFLLFSISPGFLRAQQNNNQLSNAVDNKRYQFFSQGDALFFEQGSVFNKGKTSAQSGEIFNSQLSLLYTIAEGGDELSFDWKVSSEAQYDGLIFAVLDLESNLVGERLVLTGEYDWESQNLVVPGNDPVFLVWAYSKDSIISEGLDAGWVDNVKINDKSAEITATIVSSLLLEPYSYELRDVFPTIPDAGQFPGKFYISFHSSSGEPVGGGNKYIYTELNSNMDLQATDKGGVSIHARGAGITSQSFQKIENWNWVMNPVSNHAESNLLRQGTYRNAVDFPNRFENGLSVRTEYIGRDSSGQFKIYEIKREGGTVTKLVAEFVQSFSDGPPLHGSIYYDDDLPHAQFVPPVLPEGAPLPSLPELTTAGFVARITNGFIYGSSELLNQTFTSENANLFLDLNDGSSRQQGFRFFVSSVTKTGINGSFMRGSLDIDPDQDKPLTPGVYKPAFYSLWGDVLPSFSLSPTSDRDEIYGQFRIYEIDYAASGEIEKLIADYDYRDLSLPGIATRVSLHYDATLPPPNLPPLPTPDSPLTPHQPELVNAGASLKVIALRNGSDLNATSLDSNFQVSPSSGAKGINFGIASGGQNYHLDFARSKLDIDPDKDKPLSLGVYANANGSFYTHIAPILNFEGDNIQCDLDSVRNNKFRVHDIALDENLKIIKIDLDFEQDCGPSGSKHIGSLRYDSTLPPHEFPELEIPVGSPTPTLSPLSGNGGEAILITDGVVTNYSNNNTVFTPWQYSGTAVEMMPDGIFIKDEFRFNLGSLIIDPDINSPMLPGIYENVFGYEQRPLRWMRIKKDGSYICASASAPGRYRIYDLERDSQGIISKLVADFELYCTDAPHHVTGSINFDSTQ